MKDKFCLFELVALTLLGFCGLAYTTLFFAAIAYVSYVTICGSCEEKCISKSQLDHTEKIQKCEEICKRGDFSKGESK